MLHENLDPWRVHPWVSAWLSAFWLVATSWFSSWRSICWGSETIGGCTCRVLSSILEVAAGATFPVTVGMVLGECVTKGIQGNAQTQTTLAGCIETFSFSCGALVNFVMPAKRVDQQFLFIDFQKSNLFYQVCVQNLIDGQIQRFDARDFKLWI